MYVPSFFNLSTRSDACGAREGRRRSKANEATVFMRNRDNIVDVQPEYSCCTRVQLYFVLVYCWKGHYAARVRAQIYLSIGVRNPSYWL